MEADLFTKRSDKSISGTQHVGFQASCFWVLTQQSTYTVGPGDVLGEGGGDVGDVLHLSWQG